MPSPLRETVSNIFGKTSSKKGGKKNVKSKDDPAKAAPMGGTVAVVNDMKTLPKNELKGAASKYSKEQQAAKEKHALKRAMYKETERKVCQLARRQRSRPTAHPRRPTADPRRPTAAPRAPLTPKASPPTDRADARGVAEGVRGAH